jgi:localization factor PodJL
MARATSTFQSEDYGQPVAGEWQELRGELVALLDQVETQVARTASPAEPRYQGLAERMRDLRHQVTESGTDSRHREALRSVQKAIDKFSDRDFAHGEPPTAPGNPRDTLEAAIRQIRARHFPEPQPAARAPMRQADAGMAPRFDELAMSVEGISGRLERLEAELRTQAKGQTSNVREIAEQVGQLSHVVELLAGAVGETGQVKRLEGHIAGLAKLISDGPRVDVDALNTRLDDVALTVGKLIDMQQHQADHTDMSGMTARLDDVTATVGRLADLQVEFADRVANPRDAGLKDAMKAIEDGVRNIYDRVDAVERTMAMPPAELEKITAELGRIAQLVKSPSQPQGLIELIDALNQRISDIEARNSEVGELKIDMEAFRATVLGALEPRFSALETQIGALGDQLAERPSIEPSIAQLEAQVRQLVARMDQTGEQLTGLAKLYGPPAAAPDMEALADIVATRTSAAVGKAMPVAARPGLDEAGYAEIEKRIGKLIDAAAKDTPAPETVALEATIREVNDRLKRLETSLEKPTVAAPLMAPIASETTPTAPAAAKTAPKPASRPEPIKAPDADLVGLTPDPIAPLIESLSVEDESVDAPKPVAFDDAMPADPSLDAPLRDQPFGDPDPVELALQSLSDSAPRFAAEPLASLETPETQAQPVFDPSRAERPPQPKSTLDLPDEVVFVPRPMAETSPAEDASEEEAAPSRNTFIEAHRRAARQSATRPLPIPADASSLIGRAFARFQAGADAPAPEAGEPKAKPARPAKAPKADKPKKVKSASRSPFAFLGGKSERQLAGDKEPPAAWAADEAISVDPVEGPSPADAPTAGTKSEKTGKPAEGGSFLLRHRQPILLAASVVALAFLTLNLVNQRMKADDAETSAQAVRDVGDATLTPVPMAQQGLTLPAQNSPRVVLDNLTTASIDGGMAQKFVADSPATMPQAFEAATEVAYAAPGSSLSDIVAPLALEGPVKVERPPAQIGPEPLLAAAADGDARAQFEVAAIYTEGRAVPEDLKTAAIWYERAASQGFVPAQYRLGNLYENGRGVQKDLAQARLWYQRAAEAGNRMAMHNLAALYAGGGLGQQQFDAAAKWFEEAASRGMKDSQFNLGMLYARGLGVKQDFEASYKWFSLAANRGDADAAKAREDIAGSLDAASVQRLNAEVAAFKPQAIDFAVNFAPIGTWSEQFDPGEPITSAKVVMGVQTALNLLGFEVGTPDGVAGARTAEAIKGFERATGMSEVGQINPRLLAVLGSQPV